jgi:signal transduction histidine kinase/DNA-binding NarL/FixJ family response regulator
MSEQYPKPTVLVVDDHEPAAEMVSNLFTIRGYNVTAVNSGQEALQTARQQDFDLILLDIMMPGMDGYQVLNELRSNPITADIPVIFITAKDEPTDVEQGLRLGADDYVTKPLKPRELFARVQNKLEARTLQRTLKRRTTDLEALLRVSEALNNQLELDELLNVVLYLVLDLLPCQAVFFHHLLENRDIPAEYSLQRDETERISLPFGQLLERFSEEPYINWEAGDWDNLIAMSGMSINLQHGEHLHGVLTVLGKQSFDEHHLRIFEAIGRQVTLAVRNAELYAQEVENAERLEEMVEERTAELRSAQELLIRAEKLAAAGRLAAGIAHEINNPLQPIRVNLELMQEDVEAGNPIHLEDITEALRSVKRISRIVERLQEFTRKRSDEMPDMESLPLAGVVQDVVTLSRTYAKKSGVNIQLQLDDDTYIYGNRDQLEQVFLNLILNAQAAMPDGGAIHISSKIADDKVVMHFTDTGEGIPPELISTIFEPFFSTKDDGSGLGLFISYGIMQNHNGSIDVESAVGKGTTFSLTFPLIPESEGE